MPDLGPIDRFSSHDDKKVAGAGQKNLEMLTRFWYDEFYSTQTYFSEAGETQVTRNR